MQPQTHQHKVGRQRDAAIRDGDNTMPKETFWHPQANSSDGEHFDVNWGLEQPGVVVAGIPTDRSALNRLIRVLRTARDKAYGRDE